jgi:Holliday junction resolvasome RuvABC ATP-dependent DNA helicase subunit
MSIDAAMEMFSNAEDGDVCFYDEFHKVMDGGAKNAEWMLNYLIDGVLFTPWGIEEVPKVTFVGATTEKGKILPTIVDRFLLVQLDPYTQDEAAAIAVSMSAKVFASAKMPTISMNVALAIAEAGNRQPRRMRQLLMSVRDLVVCEELDESPTGDYDLDKPLAFAGVTPDGLTKEARGYLLLLKKNGGRAGKEVLTARLGLVGSGLVGVERLLMDKALIVQTTSGRQLTIPGNKRVARLIRENA